LVLPFSSDWVFNRFIAVTSGTNWDYVVLVRRFIKEKLNRLPKATSQGIYDAAHTFGTKKLTKVPLS